MGEEGSVVLLVVGGRGAGFIFNIILPGGLNASCSLLFVFRFFFCSFCSFRFFGLFFSRRSCFMVELEPVVVEDGGVAAAAAATR